jgi:hypothetical protein
MFVQNFSNKEGFKANKYQGCCQCFDDLLKGFAVVKVTTNDWNATRLGCLERKARTTH